MLRTMQPGPRARREMLRAMLGAGVGVIVTMGMRVVHAADGAQIAIDNFTFAPQLLQVKAGTTVTWVNRDDIPHSILCPSLNMHSHAMDTNDSFSYTFTKAGVFNYICGIHPHMHGQVVVSA